MYKLLLLCMISFFFLHWKNWSLQTKKSNVGSVVFSILKFNTWSLVTSSPLRLTTVAAAAVSPPDLSPLLSTPRIDRSHLGFRSSKIFISTHTQKLLIHKKQYTAPLLPLFTTLLPLFFPPLTQCSSWIMKTYTIQWLRLSLQSDTALLYWSNKSP